MTPAEAARRFFQGATHIWLSAPDFKGLESRMTLGDWFDASLREHLFVLRRKRGAGAYIDSLSETVELAYRQYHQGDAAAGAKTMLQLLDLIHVHLHLPSKKQIDELKAKASALH
jgi:hypothetical protein